MTRAETTFTVSRGLPRPRDEVHERARRRVGELAVVDRRQEPVELAAERGDRVEPLGLAAHLGLELEPAPAGLRVHGPDLVALALAGQQQAAAHEHRAGDARRRHRVPQPARRADRRVRGRRVRRPTRRSCGRRAGRCRCSSRSACRRARPPPTSPSGSPPDRASRSSGRRAWPGRPRRTRRCRRCSRAAGCSTRAAGSRGRPRPWPRWGRRCGCSPRPRPRPAGSPRARRPRDSSPGRRLPEALEEAGEVHRRVGRVGGEALEVVVGHRRGAGDDPAARVLRARRRRRGHEGRERRRAAAAGLASRGQPTVALAFFVVFLSKSSWAVTVVL